MRTLAISAMLLSGGLLLASCARTDSPQTYQYNASDRAGEGYKNWDETPRYRQGQLRDERYRSDSPDRFRRYRSYED